MEECECCQNYDPDAFYVGWRDLASEDDVVDPTPYTFMSQAESAAREMMTANNFFGRVYYVYFEDNDSLLRKLVKQ